MSKVRIMLDSGAYTIFRQGAPIKIEDYIRFIHEKGKIFTGCFNFDVLNNSKASYENWKYLRSCGIETIPVYHMMTGEEHYLKKYLKQVDYVALGTIANLDTGKRISSLDYIWKKYLVDDKGMPVAKIHGLGLTTPELIVRYPWYSVDSFTPIISAAWGCVLLPKYVNGKLDYSDIEIIKISNQVRHEKGNTGSWLNFPKLLREIHEEQFRKHGFVIGNVCYQKVGPTRTDKRVMQKSDFWQGKLISIEKGENKGKDKTLSGDWTERERWNLIVFNKLRDVMPPYPRPLNLNGDKFEVEDTGGRTIICLGVSTPHNLSVLHRVQPYHDILISFAHMKGKMYESLVKYSEL